MEDPAAIRDALTGAYSRAMLDERLPDEVERSRRYGTSLTVLVFDVDYFKSVNDAFGHARGDAVLQELVLRVQGTIRGSDILFRFGGDEFVLLLPNTQHDPGTMVAHRVANAIASRPFPGEPPLSASVSIGLAVFPEDAQSAHSLFEAADHRNYQAKRKGRACVVSEGPTRPSDRPIQESTKLIERDAVLLQVQRFLDQLPSHRRGVLRISGNASTGRTRFLAEVMAAARLRNHTVIHLVGSRRAKLRPYGAWRLAGPVGLPAPDGGALAIARTLEIDCESRSHAGVILAVDDLPDLDPSTIELLGRLLSDESLRCLGVVYTTDPKSSTTHLENPAWQQALVELEPLSRDGTREWLRTAVQWEPPPAFVEWLHQGTIGTPGLLYQAVLHLREQGVLRRTATREWTLDPTYGAAPLSQRIRGGGQRHDGRHPPRLTDFIGREVEQKKINVLLDRSRLVSLVGAGGLGKTRLAMQIAGARAGDFADGMCFVSLAQTVDPSLVPSVVAVALGVREGPQRSLREGILASLADKEMLLVLDGFDKVLGEARLVAEVMARAPLVRILATTREPLRVSGEHVFPVPPLPVPKALNLATGEDPTRYAAVALFVLRAQGAHTGFALTAENTQAVVELCTRLGGAPLAIELAAACADRMTPAEMLEGEAGLFLAATGAPQTPAPQGARRRVIDWSCSLLDPAAQLLVARLSVFVGGAATEAVARVCDRGDLEGKTRELLATLSCKGLVQAEGLTDGEQRIHMLDLVRGFTSDRLAALGERETFQARHAEYFAGLAEQLTATLRGPRQRASLDRLEAEHPNLRAALTFSQAAQPRLCTSLALSLAPFWEQRGHWTEGRSWMGLLSAGADVGGAERVRCLCRSGRFAALQGDLDAATAHITEAMKGSADLGDDGLLALCLRELGRATVRLDGDDARAADLLEQSLVLARKLSDERGIATALGDLALLSYRRGDYDTAERLADDALALARRVGDERVGGSVLAVLGRVACARGHQAKAADLFEERVRTSEWLDDRYGMLEALRDLAEFRRATRDRDRATNAYQRHIALCREHGDLGGAACSVKDLGEVARRSGRYEEASDLCQRALRMLETCGRTAEIVWVRRAQAEIALHLGDYEEAERLYLESLDRARDNPDPLPVLLDLVGLAAIDALRERADRAARLVGAAELLFEANSNRLSPDDLTDYTQRVELVRHELAGVVLDSGTALGRALSIGEAIAFALSSGSPLDA